MDTNTPRLRKDKPTYRLTWRKDIANKNFLKGNPPTGPLHLFYQLHSNKIAIAILDSNILEANWSWEQKRVVYVNSKVAKAKFPGFNADLLLSSEGVNELNNKVEQVKEDLANIDTRLRLDGIQFDCSTIKKIYDAQKNNSTTRTKPGTNLISFIKQFVKDSTGTHKPGTLKVYTGLANQIEAFEKTRAAKITFEAIDVSLLRAFHSFLSETKYKTSTKGKIYERNINNVTAAKQMSTLKTLLNYARTLYKINVRPDYRDFKVSRKDSEFEVITLALDEFMAVYNLDLFDNKRLDEVRDVFCFSCATGLRFGDLQQLRREHVRKDNTLRMTAAKTGQKLVIPLNPFSHAILQKYSERHLPLPIISNQKTNDYIKEIGKMAGIDTPIEKVRTRGVKKITKVFKKYELLSIHIGRKSFITLSLEKGIAIQEVMSLSGHTTFKAFKRYVDVSDSRKKTVMANAWGEVPETISVKKVS